MYCLQLYEQQCLSEVYMNCDTRTKQLPTAWKLNLQAAQYELKGLFTGNSCISKSLKGNVVPM